VGGRWGRRKGAQEVEEEKGRGAGRKLRGGKRVDGGGGEWKGEVEGEGGRRRGEDRGEGGEREGGVERGECRG